MATMRVGLASSLLYPQASLDNKTRHSLHSSSIAASTSSRNDSRVRVCAQMLPFKARRQVDVPFQSGSLAPELYLKEVERIVKVTFPDSARIRFLGDSTWRATLKPVSFFNLSATPACDIRVFHENTSLKISSDKLMLDFNGVPVQFKHLDFDFSLLGLLYVAGHSVGSGASKARQEQSKRFQGWVDLGLKVDMPLPFSLMPDAILMPVGDGILDRILGAMESALLAGLIRDYRQWCRTQTERAVPPAPEAVACEKLVTG